MLTSKSWNIDDQLVSSARLKGDSEGDGCQLRACTRQDQVIRCIKPRVRIILVSPLVVHDNIAVRYQVNFGAVAIFSCIPVFITSFLVPTPNSDHASRRV